VLTHRGIDAIQLLTSLRSCLQKITSQIGRKVHRGNLDKMRVGKLHELGLIRCDMSLPCGIVVLCDPFQVLTLVKPVWREANEWPATLSLFIRCADWTAYNALARDARMKTLV
jgi:hypothetical protein